jgi:hypothetical protein
MSALVSSLLSISGLWAGLAIAVLYLQGKHRCAQVRDEAANHTTGHQWGY